mmetsp:Transcript_27951/g.80196  ORF Transcript_27951/g.80196 Transcript_27951/m.80196 type:complete len:137 (-) Transcript_27951:233-643(-)
MAGIGYGSDLGSGNVFGDVHAYLVNTMAEAEELKRVVAHMDEVRMAELEELRNEVERERTQRRESMTKFRAEFEEVVHKKLDSIFEEVEAFKKAEDGDDAAQQAEINDILADVDNMKRGLEEVQREWQRVVSKMLT